MRDDTTQKDRWQQNPHLQGLSGILQSKEGDTEGVAACKAFGYLRSIRDHAAAVEFRFRNGNSMWFPYTWLGNWSFNPSEGLLVKFSGDLVYLVLIKGSNLAKPLNEGAINLTNAGLQRRAVKRAFPTSRRTASVAGLAIVYVAAAKFGFTMAFTAEQVTLVWPPTGLALAALLLLGPHVESVKQGRILFLCTCTELLV